MKGEIKVVMASVQLRPVSVMNVWEMVMGVVNTPAFMLCHRHLITGILEGRVGAFPFPAGTA